MQGMARFRCLSALVFLLTLSASGLARAQDWGDGSDLAELAERTRRTANTIGLVYAVGGTLTFITIDMAFIGQKKAIPLEAAIPQFVYAWTLTLAGTLAAVQGDVAWGPGLLAAGGTIGAIPLVDFATRGATNQPRAALRLMPTAVTLSGTF